MLCWWWLSFPIWTGKKSLPWNVAARKPSLQDENKERTLELSSLKKRKLRGDITALWKLLKKGSGGGVPGSAPGNWQGTQQLHEAEHCIQFRLDNKKKFFSTKVLEQNLKMGGWYLKLVSVEFRVAVAFFQLGKTKVFCLIMGSVHTAGLCTGIKLI